MKHKSNLLVKIFGEIFSIFCKRHLLRFYELNKIVFRGETLKLFQHFFVTGA